MWWAPADINVQLMRIREHKCVVKITFSEHVRFKSAEKNCLKFLGFDQNEYGFWELYFYLVCNLIPRAPHYSTARGTETDLLREHFK